MPKSLLHNEFGYSSPTGPVVRTQVCFWTAALQGWRGVCKACKAVWSAILILRGSDTGLFGGPDTWAMPPIDVVVPVAVALALAWAMTLSSFLDVVSPTLAPVLEPVVVDTATSMLPMALYAWTSVAGMACAMGCVSASGKKHQVQRVSLALMLMLASASMSNATPLGGVRPDTSAPALSSSPLQEFSYADPTATYAAGFHQEVVLPAVVRQAVARFASGPVAPVVRICPDTQANVVLVPDISYLSKITSYEANVISGVSSGLASVEAVGVASFACLDRHGPVRDFSVANAHVVPSCPDVLIGTCADEEGFVFDGPNEALTLPDGAKCWVPKGSDGLFSMPAVVTSGDHSQHGPWTENMGGFTC
jgi:hypothetical protein